MTYSSNGYLSKEINFLCHGSDDCNIELLYFENAVVSKRDTMQISIELNAYLCSEVFWMVLERLAKRTIHYGTSNDLETVKTRFYGIVH